MEFNKQHSITCTFSLHPFPTKKNPEEREKWIRPFQRRDDNKPHQYLDPKPKQRVCSFHFVNGGPSTDHPYPELNLIQGKKQPLQTKKRKVDPERAARCLKRANTTTTDEPPEFPPEFTSTDKPQPSSTFEIPSQSYNVAVTIVIYMLRLYNVSLKQKNQDLLEANSKLKNENLRLKNQITTLKTKNAMNSNQSYPATVKTILKTDVATEFFTGIKTKFIFDQLHCKISPFVRRRWQGLSKVSTKVRKFTKSPKKFGPERKLTSEDEFLLVLMWLRLGLLLKDSATRFNISETLCSTIRNSWLTAMAAYLKRLVRWPEKRTCI